MCAWVWRMQCRRACVCLQLLRQVFTGLEFMHAGGRLHQSLGPASVLLSTSDERDAAVMRARLTDLAFSVDISDEALVGGATIGDLWDRGGVGGGGGPSKCAPPSLPHLLCLGVAQRSTVATTLLPGDGCIIVSAVNPMYGPSPAVDSHARPSGRIGITFEHL